MNRPSAVSSPDFGNRSPNPSFPRFAASSTRQASFSAVETTITPKGSQVLRRAADARRRTAPQQLGTRALSMQVQTCGPVRRVLSTAGERRATKAQDELDSKLDRWIVNIEQRKGPLCDLIHTRNSPRTTATPSKSAASPTTATASPIRQARNSMPDISQGTLGHARSMSAQSTPVHNQLRHSIQTLNARNSDAGTSSPIRRSMTGVAPAPSPRARRLTSSPANRNSTGCMRPLAQRGHSFAIVEEEVMQRKVFDPQNTHARLVAAITQASNTVPLTLPTSAPAKSPIAMKSPNSAKSFSTASGSPPPSPLRADSPSNSPTPPQHQSRCDQGSSQDESVLGNPYDSISANKPFALFRAGTQESINHTLRFADELMALRSQARRNISVMRRARSSEVRLPSFTNDLSAEVAA